MTTRTLHSLAGGVLLYVALGGVACSASSHGALASMHSGSPASRVQRADERRPTAQNETEARGMINDAMDSRREPVNACVSKAIARTAGSRSQIAVEVGVDQEGNLIGVKAPAGAPSDDALNSCLIEALRGANFPRSNLGVVIATERFEASSTRP